MGIFTKDIKTLEDMFLHQLAAVWHVREKRVRAEEDVGSALQARGNSLA